MKLQPAGKIGKPVRKTVSKTQLPVKFDIGIFHEKFMVLHAFRDFLHQQGNLLLFLLQDLPDVICPETVEVSPADIFTG